MRENNRKQHVGVLGKVTIITQIARKSQKWHTTELYNGLQCLEFGGCMMQNISAPSGQQELLQDIYKGSTNQYTMLCLMLETM